MACTLSHPEICGIFPDQRSNLCPLHWLADSYPLYHQGSPNLFSVSQFACSGCFTQVNTCQVCGPFCLFSFTSNSGFEVRPQSGVWALRSFSQLDDGPCMDNFTPIIHHPSMDPGCFYLTAAVTAGKTVGRQLSVQVPIFNSLGYVPRSGVAGSPGDCA